MSSALIAILDMYNKMRNNSTANNVRIPEDLKISGSFELF
jgi:hypothetical protein